MLLRSHLAPAKGFVDLAKMEMATSTQARRIRFTPVTITQHVGIKQASVLQTVDGARLAGEQ